MLSLKFLFRWKSLNRLCPFHHYHHLVRVFYTRFLRAVAQFFQFFFYFCFSVWFLFCLSIYPTQKVCFLKNKSLTSKDEGLVLLKWKRKIKWIENRRNETLVCLKFIFFWSSFRSWVFSWKWIGERKFCFDFSKEIEMCETL